MIRFYRSQYPKENVVIEALYEGCPEAKELTTLDDYQPSEVAVVMGVYKKAVPASFQRGRVIAQQKERGLDSLILETGFLERGDGPESYYHLGWNGLNGRADFRNANSPADRAARFPLGDWKYGEHILLCGQVPWDASVDFSNHQAWLLDAAENIQAISSRCVVFRPHPLAPLPNLPGCKYSKGRTLEEDLQNCHCLVTFNSNSAVEALVSGIPVFSFDRGSMVWSVCNKDWMAIENPERLDRTQWLADLAYAQWNCEELRSGEAWNHIGHLASQVAA